MSAVERHRQSLLARRGRDRQERRDRILDAAERVIASRGLGMTMDEVAQGAELAKGTLYLYFANKDALVTGLALRNQLKILERFGLASAQAETGIEALEGMLVAYVDHFVQRPRAVRCMLHAWMAEELPIRVDAPGYQEVANHRQRIFHRILSAIERGRHDGSIRIDLESEPLALQLWGALIGSFMINQKRECFAKDLAVELPESSLLRPMVKLLIDGLAPRPASRQSLAGSPANVDYAEAPGEIHL